MPVDDGRVGDPFVPHDVDWTSAKVSRFWDYLATNHGLEFFSEKHSHDLVDRLLKAARPSSVVDIGCGTGPLAAEFTRRGIETIGVDSSPGVLAAARSRVPGATFLEGSVTSNCDRACFRRLGDFDRGGRAPR